MVIPVDVLPAGLGRVRAESIEFDSQRELVEEVVQISRPQALPLPNLAPWPGQTMGAFNVSQIAALQVRENSFGDLFECHQDIGPPAQPRPAGRCPA